MILEAPGQLSSLDSPAVKVTTSCLRPHKVALMHALKRYAGLMLLQLLLLFSMCLLLWLQLKACNLTHSKQQAVKTFCLMQTQCLLEPQKDPGMQHFLFLLICLVCRAQSAGIQSWEIRSNTYIQAVTETHGVKQLACYSGKGRCK